MRRLLVVDDDDLTRELVELLAAEAGLVTESFASGDAALAHLRSDSSAQPDAVITDMRMPGLCGPLLAAELRCACGPSTRLIAMSGSPISQEEASGFDQFLLKPFSVKALGDACGVQVSLDVVSKDEPERSILSDAVYTKLLASMPAERVTQFYTLCLADARKRVKSMRTLLERRDAEGFRAAAHAIKGGCSFVGALEMTELASRLERSGPSATWSVEPLDELNAASDRLERILNNKWSRTDGHALEEPASGGDETLLEKH